MAISAIDGPFVVYGQQPAQNGYTPDYNQDGPSPSVFQCGTGLGDPRLQYTGGNGNGTNRYLGFLDNGPRSLEIVPATANVSAISANAHTTGNTSLTLVSGNGSGITVMSAAFTNILGNTVPACLQIDTAPATIGFGQTGAIQIWDPTTIGGRALAILAAAGASGGNFSVSGYDVYGVPMHETINAAGNATTNGKKAFKYVQTVTPLFSDAQNYSVGTADIFGFPIYASSFSSLEIFWGNATAVSQVTAVTGFVAGNTTTATALTGDVRGTYAVQSASDGNKTLTVFQHPRVQSIGNATGLFGVTQF